MGLILNLLHLGDNKKDREYISDATTFLKQFEEDNTTKSESQKKEILKHRNIFRRHKHNKFTL